MLKKLPVTTYTFRDIIEGQYLYVDKTSYIYDLIQYPKTTYFLSRPRRFGKSLLISILAEIFKGNRDLFQDLWLGQSDYEWQVYSVIRFDFSRNTVKTVLELEQVLEYYLEEIAQEHGLNLLGFNHQSKFQNLIRQLGQTEKVVILIDEYDKPIIDNIENIEEAKRIRDTLKAFYAVIKAMDEYLHIVFITGISKFSQVGVFSFLNNLVNLTLNTQFSGLLGLTEAEIKRDFAAHITVFAKKLKLNPSDILAEIAHWYNGFCFAADGETVYNPYSVIHLLYHQRFANYWFETRTPTFLIKLIRDNNYDLEHFKQVRLTEIHFSTYDLENLAIIPLLFQTGYLTLKDSFWELGKEMVYTLAYPNFEVEHAFLTYLLGGFSYLDGIQASGYLNKLIKALQDKDLEQVFEIMSVFFANVPYNLQLKYEKYYQSLFYVIFMMLEMEIEVEVETNAGRIDAVVVLNEDILLFEFKIDKTAQEALQQIKDNRYYQKYRLHHKKMTLVGANFNSQTRCVDDWDSEMVA